MSDKVLSKLFLVPILICIAVFILYPIYLITSLSLQDQMVYSNEGIFIGMQNYIEVLKNAEFWQSLSNSMIWTFGSIFLQLTLGILVAVLLNENFPGRNVTRSIVLFSYIVPEVVVALVWRYMLNDATGVINYFIRDFQNLSN